MSQINNVDDAFVRRFQSIIHFPMLGPRERERLWRQSFPPQVQLEPSIDLEDLAARYELSGADIMNVVQYCCLKTLKRGDGILAAEDLLSGIKREFSKVGKIIG